MPAILSTPPAKMGASPPPAPPRRPPGLWVATTVKSPTPPPTRSAPPIRDCGVDARPVTSQTMRSWAGLDTPT